MFFKEYYKEFEQKADIAEKSLREYFSSRNFDAPKEIVEAVEYALFSPGKKIRPVLLREFANLIGDESDRVDSLADAIEMIHSYSLIHDDLPAMDNATLRRGKPSCHVAYGEAIAILAGDALLNLAMERAIQGIPEDEPEYYLNALKLLFNASGIDGMVGGQTADIQGSDDIEYVERHKTGAILKAAILCGPLCYINKEDERIKILEDYAESIGRAFQIYDDLLDVTADSEETGKNSNLDVKNETKTFVSVYGIDRSREEIEALRLRAQSALDALKVDEDSFIRFLTDYICGDRGEK